MTKVERTVTAGPRLSRSEDALPHGLRAADPAELENVAGGLSLGGILDTIDKVTKFSQAVTFGGLLGGLIYTQT
jgi:hypothetical protein